jgi:hypothetical protein
VPVDNIVVKPVTNGHKTPWASLSLAETLGGITHCK